MSTIFFHFFSKFCKIIRTSMQNFVIISCNKFIFLCENNKNLGLFNFSYRYNYFLSLYKNLKYNLIFLHLYFMIEYLSFTVLWFSVGCYDTTLTTFIFYFCFLFDTLNSVSPLSNESLFISVRITLIIMYWIKYYLIWHQKRGSNYS